MQFVVYIIIYSEIFLKPNLSIRVSVKNSSYLFNYNARSHCQPFLINFEDEKYWYCGVPSHLGVPSSLAREVKSITPLVELHTHPGSPSILGHSTQSSAIPKRTKVANNKRRVDLSSILFEWKEVGSYEPHLLQLHTILRVELIDW